MATAPPLVSAASLASYAEGSDQHAAIDFTAQGAMARQVTAALRTAEAIGGRYVGVPLRVHLRDDDLRVVPFRAADPAGADRGRYAWAPLPVCEAVGPDGVTVSPASPRKLLVPGTVEGVGALGRFRYYAGWREADETTADLQGYDGLDGIDGDTEVPVLPDDLFAAIAETALFIVGRVRGGHVGQSTRTVDTGQAAVTTRGYSVTTPEVAAIWETYASHHRALR